MANARISGLNNEFYSQLHRESDEELQRKPLAACRYAVEKSLPYPAILNALKAMTNGKPLSQ
jgi:hypothetical protein